jgi:1-deoxy-D-xylulose-5-phosphate reductoisomerase
MKPIAVLGSTGSIGMSTLAVAEAHPGHFDVVALAAGRNLDRLRSQLRHHRPAVVGVTEAGDARALAAEFRGIEVLWGDDGLEQIARYAAAEMVVMAVVGAAGVAPTMAAIGSGKDVALANKETLVVAGDLIMAAVEKSGTRLLPVDSELGALHRLLQRTPAEHVSRLILTASGGPFRLWPHAAMEEATVDEALAHPTWRMGAKISIDSATMMNKGFEIIGAHHFFGIPADRIDVVVHPQSLIHAMVELADGSIETQMSANDMRLAIAHALAWPVLLSDPAPSLDLTAIPPLTFEEPDRRRFPALDLARDALREGGEMPAVLNAANEVAVAAFLNGRCLFPAVTSVVADTLEAWAGRNRPLTGLDQIFAADGEARALAADTIMKYDASVRGSEIRC